MQRAAPNFVIALHKPSPTFFPSHHSTSQYQFYALHEPTRNPHPSSNPSHPIPRRTAIKLARNTAIAIAVGALFPHHTALSAARGLPAGAAEAVLKNVAWPPSWPYTSSDFARFDTRPDDEFYAFPRLVRHIDDGAVAALKRYYAGMLPWVHGVLDVCSSVEAYLAETWEGRGVVAGLGMNEVELAHNRALSEHVVVDLNARENLPYRDGSFDVVMCNVSIDYLTKPRGVLAEMARVLRPGGRVVISFSDRVFAIKAIAVWTGGGDVDHIYTVASYIHYAVGFSEPMVEDLSPRRNGVCTGDPIYVVWATRLA